MRHFLLSGALLASGISAQVVYDDSHVDNMEYPDGNHWTGWSNWYGCAQSTSFGVVVRPDIATKQEFCSYSGKTQLNSIRYRECVRPDNFKYPDNVKDSSKMESRYASDITGDIDAFFNGDMEDPSFSFGEFIPTSGYPNSAPSLYPFVFSNGDLGVSSHTPPLNCDYNEDKTLRESCQQASSNIRCDPRLQRFADRHNEANAFAEGDDGFITEDDVWDLLIIDENADVKRAIPEPYLTYQVQEAICPNNCPVPLPWTSWNCHCDQGSTAADSDPDSLTDASPSTNPLNRNPDNLPQCDCGKFKRRRYQLCYDDDTTDDVTCESIGSNLATDYEELCKIQDHALDATTWRNDWYRSWYRDEFNNETHSVPFWNAVGFEGNSDPNWFEMAHWLTSRDQNTPFRRFEVNSILSETDDYMGEGEKVTVPLVKYLDDSMTEKQLNVSADARDALYDLFRDLVVSRWMEQIWSDFDSRNDGMRTILNHFFDTYPKFNIFTGAHNGCNFRDASGFADFDTFADFFAQDEADYDFAVFEAMFQSCVFDSYFRDYDLYRNNETYPSIVRQCDWLRLEDGEACDDDDTTRARFDMDDFANLQATGESFAMSFIQDPIYFYCNSSFPSESPQAEILYGLFDIEMTEDGNMNCTILEGVNADMWRACDEWKDSSRFAARFNAEFDGFGTWANATNMEQMFTFFKHQMFHIFNDTDGYNLNYDGFSAYKESWMTADHMVSMARGFTNSIINLIIDPSMQHHEVDIGDFIAGLEGQHVINDLCSCHDEDECVEGQYCASCARWANEEYCAGRGDWDMYEWFTAHDEYTRFGLYNMTAVMYAEQMKLRPEHVDMDQDRRDGWRSYNIHPFTTYHPYTAAWWYNVRPQNNLEYNYNEQRQNLLFEEKDESENCPSDYDPENADFDTLVTDPAGRCRTGYVDTSPLDLNLIQLTGAGAYADACWSGEGLGSVVNPFGYNYFANHEQYEVRFELFDNDGILRIYHEDMTIKKSLQTFIRNRYTSIEVGYQEEECVSDVGELTPWGEWGECDAGCGVGHQWRTKDCATPAGNVLVNQDFLDNGNYSAAPWWMPNSWADWGINEDEYVAPACQCDGVWAESRECFTGCEYGDWEGWRADDYGNTCFLNDAKWNWEADGAEGPPSCVPMGHDNVGTRYRTREIVCGDAETCCDHEHEVVCHIPFCTGWKDWGSWSEWSVSCGVDKTAHRMRTRDCLGMDNEVGDSAKCPCHASFAIDECTFGADNSCSGYYSADAGWNSDDAHDDDDPGYLQIDSRQTQQCPYLRRACQDDRDVGLADTDGCDTGYDELYWSDWSDCSRTCGEGIQRRHRECLPWADDDENPNRWLGNVPGCRDGIVREIRYCEDQPACPYMGHWMEWSECSESCGDNGMQTRTRMCSNNGEEVACGDFFLDGFSQDRECRRGECPRLSEWTVWEECSEACRERNGYTKMVRSCMFGDEGDLGCDCHYSDDHPNLVCEDGEGLVRYERCNTDIHCPYWAVWQTWSVCEDFNGISGHRRTRVCIDPQDETNDVMGARECQEHDRYEIVACYDEECPAE